MGGLDVFEAVSNWGLGIALAIIIVLMLKKLINSVISNFHNERKIYVNMINKQSGTIDNNINSLASHIVETNLCLQKLCVQINDGFNGLQKSMEYQTDILRKNGGNDNE